MSVKVEGLTKVYNGKKAIDDVSFSVKKGEILGFLGSNGAGKTTTMKILACFIPQSSGSATVCDFDVSQNPEEVRKRIGYLPEHNPLYKHMYIPEFLDFVSGLHGVQNKKSVIKNIIEMTGLGEERSKRIGELSKGYKQRVGLAQALIHDPEVLILDEPTNGLDPTQLKEMRSTIKSLGKEKTILFSSHIMQEIEAVCDRVIIIHDGVLRFDDAISSGDQGDQLIEIRFGKQIAKTKVSALDSIEEIVRQEGKSYYLKVVSPKKVKADLMTLAASENTYIDYLGDHRIDLEEIFLKLTSNS